MIIENTAPFLVAIRVKVFPINDSKDQNLLDGRRENGLPTDTLCFPSSDFLPVNKNWQRK
jgi:hypothetical protein